MRAAVAGFADLAASAGLRLLVFLGCLAGNLQGDDAARQQHRPRSVGAISLAVKAKSRGQDLILSGSEHRGQRGGVMVVRVERRQAGEKVRTSRGKYHFFSENWRFFEKN